MFCVLCFSIYINTLTPDTCYKTVTNWSNNISTHHKASKWRKFVLLCKLNRELNEYKTSDYVKFCLIQTLSDYWFCEKLSAKTTIYVDFAENFEAGENFQKDLIWRTPWCV